ncbi:unannotated protein [freshwater metagenome]|uniref:Unannotated protein n=1 Tax=freshwater metagenome TaxID=449393 RepID=A0A6J6M7E0_9ZZZZ
MPNLVAIFTKSVRGVSAVTLSPTPSEIAS